MWIDSHCHLDFASFDADREAVLKRCAGKQLSTILIPGVTIVQGINLQRMIDELVTPVRLLSAIGLHPYWVQGWLSQEELTSVSPDDARAELAVSRLKEALVLNSCHSSCVAIGEVGLDALVDVDMAWQQRILVAHLEVAKQLNLPIILHSRKADNSLLELLKYYRLERGGQLHGFTGSLQMAQSYWRLGYRLGVGGSVTYDRARKTRLAVSQLPEEALLLETDAPDMPICGRQGKRNSPEWITEIAAAVAELRGLPLSEVAAITRHNFSQLYGV